MPNDRFEFLAAIRARPEDNALRLTLADWLEQQSEPEFAQVIRLELERDQLPKGDARRQALNEQLKPLWPKLPKDFRPAGIYTQTHRGLPWYIDGGVLVLRNGIEQLGPYAPRPFVLLGGNTMLDKQAEEEFASGGVDRIGAAIRELFASRWVREWQELQILYLTMTAERVRWMTASGNLTGLEYLSFRDCADDGAVRAVAAAELPRLKALAIEDVMCWEYTSMTSDAFLALVDSPLLAQLDGLILYGPWFDEAGLQALARSPSAVKLNSLNIRPHTDCWAGAGMRALLASPHLAGLEFLSLSLMSLDAEIAALLARPDTLPGLKRLVITYEDEKYRDVLQPRFGNGLYVGSLEGD